MAPRVHVVRSGESLASIAASYGWRDWKVVYGASANAELRRKRPDPNRLQPGDRVFIPPTPQIIALGLIERLKRLEDLRAQSAETFDGLDKELTQAFRKVDTAGKQADATADVALVIVDLTKIVKSGFKAMKLTGDALEAANTKIAQEATKLAYKPIVDKSAEYWADQEFQPGDGLMKILGKTIVTSWFDMTKPSFWANVVSNLQDGQSWSTSVTRKPEDILAANKAKINQQRSQTLGAVDKRIAELREELRRANVGSVAIP